MNVLHIDEQRGWRGGEQQASYLIRGLAAHGVRCVLAGRPNSPFLTRDHGVAELTRVAVPFAGEIDLWTAWRLARVVRRHQIDILHAHTGHSHALACLARTMAGRGHLVVSRRVDFPPAPNLFSRWKYRRADRVVAISQRIEEILAEFGIEREKLRMVYSGVDFARMDVPPLPRSELGVPEDAPLIGSVAALVPHKDQVTLVAAMVGVRAKLPDARLVIAGEGPLRPALEAQIADLGLEGTVKLLGYRRDVPRLLRTLDAFVLSSTTEGLGTSILDAMACRVPVVATAGGGIPEMVINDETGLLAPVGDAAALAEALVRVLLEPNLATRLAQTAWERVLPRHSVAQMVEGNLSVYRELLGTCC